MGTIGFSCFIPEYYYCKHLCPSYQLHYQKMLIRDAAAGRSLSQCLIRSSMVTRVWFISSVTWQPKVLLMLKSVHLFTGLSLAFHPTVDAGRDETKLPGLVNGCIGPEASVACRCPIIDLLSGPP